MVTKIYIEGNLLDLYDDEVMELNSSIADSDDITKINSDYTKTFTVPASNNNNTIFRNFYDADIDNTFDARTKKNASIELDGFPFKVGKIRLEKVSVKKGKASSYTINFWGDLVNFKELFKNDELNVLDLSAYDHAYTSANVKQGLTTGLFNGDIVYNLLSKKKRYIYDETVSNNTNTSNMVNIAYNGLARGVEWNQLQPSIRLLSIIEAIESKYNFIFSRDFFSRADFTNLYMWVNKDKKNDSVSTSSKQINFVSGNTTYVNLTTDVGTFDAFYTNSNNKRSFAHSVIIFPELNSLETPYKLKVFLNNSLLIDFELEGNSTTDFYISTLLATGTYTLRLEVESISAFGYLCNWRNVKSQTINGVHSAGVYDTIAGLEYINGVLNIANQLPKIKIIDFLKGLFSMFKLIAIPLPNGDVYINNLDDYYREGKVYDVTKYIDFESYDVERGKINNQIDFKYQEPTTILNQQFKLNTGIAYGDELLSLADANGVPLDGDKLELTLPFEQVLFERLTDIQTNTISNIQYGLILDDKLEPANPKPLIFYNNLVQLGNNKISFVNEVLVSELINTTINTPSHTLGFTNPTFSTLWGVEFSTWDYVAINGTLFFNYWKNYITSVFNVKKRNFKYKAFLPVYLLTKLQLNDVLFIKERYYRINSFNVNLLNGDANLNLVNTFETNFGLFKPSQDSVLLNYTSQTYTVSVSNGSVMNMFKDDLGYGTSWATLTQTGSNIVIDVTENTLIENRKLFIRVDNGSGKSFEIYLNQDNKIVSCDTTEYTFDSTTLNFDAN